MPEENDLKKNRQRARRETKALKAVVGIPVRERAA